MLGGISLAPLKIDVKVTLDKMKTGFNKVKDESSKVVKSITKDFNSLQKAGDGLKSIGSTLTKSISLPLAGLGVVAAKMAIDFESSFAKVSTLLDSNSTDFTKYKQDIIKASNESGIAVGEFSEAVYQSISAGVDSAKAIDFTTQAMNLAKGGFTDGAKAVDIITTALNGYKMETSEATKVSDLLITTQNLGKTTVDELASSMGKVIPVAANSNFSIEELSASYAMLTKNGIATAESGTYMRSMLSELTKSGSTADKALRKLSGKGFAQLKAEGKPTTEILKMLDDNAKKNGKSLKDMFGSVEAGTAAMVLASGSGAEYNEILKAMEQSAGATEVAAKKMEDTLGFKLKKAINELKNSFIGFGDVLAPALQSLATGLQNVATWLGNLSPEAKKAIMIFGGFMIIIPPILTLVGGLISTFASLSIVAGALGVSIAAIAAPIGIAIAAFVAMGVAVATNFGGIRDCITSVMNSVREVISSVVTRIKSLWESNFLGIQTFTTGLWNQIKLTFKTVFDAIKDIFNVFSKVFQGDWKGAWEAVKTLGTNIWNNIKSLFKNFLNTVVDTLLNIGVSLYGAARTAWDNVKKGASEIWEAIKSWFKGAVEDPVGTLKSIGSAMFSAGKSIFTSAWDGMKSIWSSITGWVSEKVSWLSDKLAFWRKGKSEIDGSHYNGLSYVPFDGYLARLHKGERVLTAKENKELTQGKANDGQGGSGITLNIENFVNNRKQDVRELAEELELYRRQISYR